MDQPGRFPRGYPSVCSAYFTSLANIAYRLDEAGADGLVLFNRFYEPDFDLEKLEAKPT